MDQLEIVISPNASLSRQANIALFLSLMGILLVVATGFTLMGFWMILPFAGLELIALAVALAYVDYQNQYREVVKVDEVTVKIASGYRKAQHACEFKRGWTSVLLRQSSRQNQPSKLILRSAGKQIEIGACLEADDRKDLWRELKQVIEQPANS